MRSPVVSFALVVLAVLTCGACAGPGGGSSILDKGTVVVGVRPDLPGLGLRRPDGTFEGFEVDVARDLAVRLGWKVRFVAALAADREPLLLSGRADLMFGTFSVTPERKLKVAFAGPYHVSYQDILVRSGDRRINGVRDLKGRRICAVEGANAAERVVRERGVPAVPVPAPHYDRCMAMLRTGEVEAITTNDVILAGLIARERGAGLRLVGAGFGEQRTGIGMRRGDVAGCEALNRAITQMYQDGTARRLLLRWFDGTGLELGTIAVPQFEGCS
ncbi:amino acid ABC transporter substrate-binding protein, PAAT family [Thermomonospora echinospora]|uniref:Amino acid ABC transporter substrate-binding protein, PAAT family n=1 Tax=Thermomonospora echinospora TaxID=1992 RepID=A0A1H6CAH3_9ACTN|nr:transporter substrate-binding domain-containing protein [Thermomonospora echinospora]SEG69918.1 amino acid ABC transporter substrate-binding protein, PAAT family [Thermomonospora echinospora]